MSLLPFNFNNFHANRPFRLVDQHFGMYFEATNLSTPFIRETNRTREIPSFDCLRPWGMQNNRNDIRSEISMERMERDKFLVNLDVKDFNPEEITVKVAEDNKITVEARHEEKRNKDRYISRQFVREYVLPKDDDIKQVHSKLSSDGVLTITGVRANMKPIKDKTIPIQKSGFPSAFILKKRLRDKMY